MDAVHALVPCAQDNRSIDFHTKSYSYEFCCPICRKTRRFNTNYLGSRRVPMCDGKQIKAGPKLDWDGFQSVRAQLAELVAANGDPCRFTAIGKLVEAAR